VIFLPFPRRGEALDVVITGQLGGGEDGKGNGSELDRELNEYVSYLGGAIGNVPMTNVEECCDVLEVLRNAAH
jgi:hypothetical protein